MSYSTVISCKKAQCQIQSTIYRSPTKVDSIRWLLLLLLRLLCMHRNRWSSKEVPHRNGLSKSTWLGVWDLRASEEYWFCITIIYLEQWLLHASCRLNVEKRENTFIATVSRHCFALGHSNEVWLSRHIPSMNWCATTLPHNTVEFSKHTLYKPSSLHEYKLIAS